MNLRHWKMTEIVAKTDGFSGWMEIIWNCMLNVVVKRMDSVCLINVRLSHLYAIRCLSGQQAYEYTFVN